MIVHISPTRMVSNSSMLRLVMATVLFASRADAAEPPRVLDANWQIQLISSEPELVTPTGCCFDDQGRLLVIECHTHFPPEDYEGPKTDRIYLFDDTDGDGVLDRKRLFYEGGVATMNITSSGDGWFVVATRSELVGLRDSDGDDVADQREVLLTHSTKADYPHNGLGGLTLGPDGWLYVGQGENFGEPYELIGSDGSKQIGGGEGGNIFRCKPDGRQVERVATGFWNPFGMCFDAANRLWVVDNDPDAMPPNRLLHVVHGGDYGFQFRFGRAGIHPLQSWNGEFPETLPMVAGTGEGACAVITHGRHLWVTSWGDNRIERHILTPRGASWNSKRDVVVQGDASFRPVGMAVAEDGSIYVTDWVDRSYPVHGQGRLWRISRKSGVPAEKASLPELTDVEQEAARLRSSSQITAKQRLTALQSEDPFVRQAAITGLIRTKQLDLLTVAAATPSDRVALLSAWRWKELSTPESVSTDQRRRLVQSGLQDDSDEVVLTALRWATERGCQELLPTIRTLLDRKPLSPRVFAAVVASIAYLETGSAAGGKRDPAIEKLLIEFAGDSDRSAALRALAVQRIPVEAESPTDDELHSWLANERSRPLALEVVRLLSARARDTAEKQLAAIALDNSFDVQTRTDALAGLSTSSHGYGAIISRLEQRQQPPVLQTELTRIGDQDRKPDGKSRPAPDDIDAWAKLVEQGGDREAGRRVFVREGCSMCHTHTGRGATTGPDLTSLSSTMTRRRVLESVLQPSREVAPLYVPWMVETTDGEVFIGLKLDAAGLGRQARFQGADGKIFEVPLADIEEQKSTEQSIMPTGLEETMTLDELRDLVAFLTAG